MPTLFIAYTIKGYGLPFAGHKDNHAGLMNPGQIAALRAQMGIAEGAEWEPWAGLGGNSAEAAKALVETSRIALAKRARPWNVAEVPAIAPPAGEEQSTQAAFGKILLDLSRAGGTARRPDRHHLARRHRLDQSRRLGEPARPVPPAGSCRMCSRRRRSPRRRNGARIAAGQHIELGIAENNLFLMLAALGLAGDLFGERLFPIGTVYDPFIARGLDALNYACYQDARFMLVATPSGVTLGPEGGAHQSINPPLIALGQPGLRHYEPAFVDELAAMMEEGFRLMQARGRRERLSAPHHPDDRAGRAGRRRLEGGRARRRLLAARARARGRRRLWSIRGAIAPEALAAWEALEDDVPGLGLLAVTSPDLLHRGWSERRAGRWTGGGAAPSHVETLLAPLSRDAGLVTLLDGAPASLSWLGGVAGHKVSPLGLERFGQTGSLPDLYRAYRLDVDAIVEAAAELFLD